MLEVQRLFRQAKHFDNFKQAVSARGNIHGFHVEDLEAFEPIVTDFESAETENGLRDFF